MNPTQMRMLNEGKIDDVVLELEAELRRKSGDLQAKEDLALAYSQGRRDRDAIRLYEDILRSKPNEPGILVNLGFCYIGIDDRRALEVLDKVCQIAKVEPVERQVMSMALTNLGAIYEKYHFFETAYDKYKIAHHIFPENHLAARYLKQLEDMADPDNGPVGLRKMDNGAEVQMLWDGSYFKGKRMDVDVSDIKLK